MRHLAVIPARSGSKGLKDKNIKMLVGKPMLAYSVEAAKEAGLFNCIHVSTDSEHYADIARQSGAEVPFLRSTTLATEDASSWDVVKEALKRYREVGQQFDMVTLLQPTSPLRTSGDIKGAFSFLLEKQAKAVVSVCEMDHSPLWCDVLPKNQSLAAFAKSVHSKRRQELATYYRINGAIYMTKTDFLYEDTNLYREGCYAYIMDRRHSVDVDTQTDFDMASYFLIRGDTTKR